jgi:DNA repair protein endonuclease SAE2/CtIP C-terminus
VQNDSKAWLAGGQGPTHVGVAGTSSHNAALLAAQHQLRIRSAGHVPGAGPAVFDEKVRKQAERTELAAWDCPECMRFFTALERQGKTLPTGALNCPDCKAARDQGAGAAGRDVGELRQAAGRHRSRFVAPATPKNFWCMGFADRKSP